MATISITPEDFPYGTGEKTRRNRNKKAALCPNAGPGSICCCACCLPLGFGFGISFLLLGILYFEDCPAEVNLPPLIIAYGSMFVIMQMNQSAFTVVEMCRTSLGPPNTCQKAVFLTNLFLFFATFVMTFVIAGFLYDIWEPNYSNKLSPEYCDETFYLFSFIMITVLVSVFGLLVLFGCCACCIACTVVAKLKQMRKKKRAIKNKKMRERKEDIERFNGGAHLRDQPPPYPGTDHI